MTISMNDSFIYAEEVLSEIDDETQKEIEGYGN